MVSGMQATGATADIINALRKHRFCLDDEKRLQSSIANILTHEGIPFVREVRLAVGDIIDFVSGRVGIEIKIKGQRRAIYRQCERYCAHDALDSLILATNAPMGMPPEINGKPIFFVSLGQGWLGC